VGISTASLPAVIAAVVIGAVALSLLPRNALPAAALWLLVLFPVGYMDVPALVGRYITPAVIIIAIWMIRLAVARRSAPLLGMPIRGWLITGPLLVLLFASTVFSERIDRTLAWTAVFIVCVIAPALLGQVSVDDLWPTVRWALAGIGLFLGVLAAADFFFHFNPWTSLYVRHYSWPVFRSSTSLGHPLNTAMVASVALAACLFPSSKSRQWPYWICAVGALVALILSVSRVSVIAVGVSAIIGMLSARPRTGQSVTRGRGWRGRLIAVSVAATFFAAVAFSPLLSNRNSSEEGRNSAIYRSRLLDRATTLIYERPMLGSGPGTSGEAYANSTHLALENSALQLMVSIGIPASLFVLVGFGVLVTVAMRRSRAGVAAGIVAFWISAVGSNAIDSDPSTLALIAPLIACAVVPGPGRSEHIENNGPRTARQTMNRDDGIRGSRVRPARRVSGEFPSHQT
jgi:O-antigen ligase/polysaccharide polymerase Wzy-like membrane protein